MGHSEFQFGRTMLGRIKFRLQKVRNIVMRNEFRNFPSIKNV
jgi:hypothetical protein